MRRILSNRIVMVALIIVILLILVIVSHNEKSGVNIVGNVISIPAAPLQKTYTFISGKIEDFFGYFEDISDTKAKNEELQQRVGQLEQQVLELDKLKDDNKKLRDALNFKDQFDEYDFIGSSIIAKDPGNWFNVFTINRGAKDNIKVDSPVITAYGLAGRVSKTDLVSSRVVSIIDIDSTVSARLSKTRDLIVVRGDVELRSKGLCRADYIPPNTDVMPGDTVETSGIGGIYPKGIIIGKVVSVVSNEGQYDSYAVIEPVVDFKRLEEVLVLNKEP
ncbi:MAG TPA: rod shape-determining protein MreC [Bacillota bacterium]|nr:rod shape-determining protein MreC [Bacillota bacterium]